MLWPGLVAWPACRLKKKALQQAYDLAIKRKMVRQEGGGKREEGEGTRGWPGCLWGGFVAAVGLAVCVAEGWWLCPLWGWLAAPAQGWLAVPGEGRLLVAAPHQGLSGGRPVAASAASLQAAGWMLHLDLLLLHLLLACCCSSVAGGGGGRPHGWAGAGGDCRRADGAARGFGCAAAAAAAAAAVAAAAAAAVVTAYGRCTSCWQVAFEPLLCTACTSCIACTSCTLPC